MALFARTAKLDAERKKGRETEREGKRGEGPDFGQGHATQAQEAPVRGSGDGYSLRSRSLDASATVGHRRPTPVRVPKGTESLLDPEIEFGHAIAQQINARQTGLFPAPTGNRNTTPTPPGSHTTKPTNQKLTLVPENLTPVPSRQLQSKATNTAETENLTH